MTTPTPGDAAVLIQILDTLGKLGERLAVVESDLKTVIRDHTKDLDDHEVRLRHLETVAREAVSRTDLETLETTRREEAKAALELADKKANRRLVIIGLSMTGVVAAINVAIALITR